MICTSCQTEITPETRVCGVCGHPVSKNPTLEHLYFSRLAATAPKRLVQKVRSVPYLSKEQRNVTAMILTIANVDEFAKKVPEEERSSILNTALDRIAGVIFEFEGSIAKLWENTLLAFFGAPVTHEDDPQRAIHAAGSILSEMEKYSQALQEKFDVPFDLHLVLNTGPILIGELKSNLQFDFQSRDDTLECLDQATRMAIPRNAIILFEDTFRFVKPFVQCTALSAPYCSKIDEDHHLWQVDRINRPGTSLLRTPNNSSTPLIGRESELERLLELSETVLAGLGRVCMILGEPGIGKSRLVMEWKQQLKTLHQPTRLRWIEAHGQSFGRELAYHLLKSLLRSALEIGKEDSSDEILAKIETKANNLLSGNTENIIIYLAHLLDIQLTEEKETYIHQLKASELQGKYLNALQSFFKALALEQPLVIALEDLHWADKSSIGILMDFLPITATAPILICLVTRPYRDSDGWALVNAVRSQIGPRLTEITLQNFSAQESEELINELIDLQNLPNEMRTLILKKSEGNPLFIEELLRMLTNDGMLVQENGHWRVAAEVNTERIPDSLQGLLTARIDRLPAEARDTMRVASVIGRTFPEKVIERVLLTQSPNVALMEQLSILESIGMIRVIQVHPELIYSFQHILLHDAAYHSIIEEDRSKLHLAVGSALEDLYPGQLDRLASQLAHHFSKGNHTEKAIHYFDKAGHVSRDSFANAEAEYYFSQAIQITGDHASLAHLYTDLGEALAQQGRHRPAVQAWRRAIEFHQELQNTNQLARVYAWSARSAWWGYDRKHGLEICLEGLEAVRDKPESADIAYLIHETGRAYFFNDQPEKAQLYCEQALEMAKRLKAYDVQAEALATIGVLPNLKPEKAIESLEMAVKVSEAHNLFGPASRAYINLAFVVDKLGDTRLARDYRKRVLQLGVKAGGISDELSLNQSIINASLWLADFEDVEQRLKLIEKELLKSDSYLDEMTLNSLYLKGCLQRYKGDFSNAINTFTDLIERSRQTHNYELNLQANHCLAEIILESHLLEMNYSNISELDIVMDMLTDVIKTPQKVHVRSELATQCLIGEIYTLKNNLDLAQAAVEKANSIYQKHPNKQDRIWIALAQARLALARGQDDLALDHLSNAAQWLEEMEGRWWHARVLLEIGLILLKRNGPEDIDQAQNTFREVLSEFKEMDVGYYQDVIIEKLRELKRISRAQAIAHRKITQELAEAGRVQNTFIPTHSPTITGYQVAGVLLPAHETSGDFYDFIELEDGKLGVVIADVGDKGAGAALYMAMSRTLIRTYAGEEARPPEDVISQVNRRILTDTQNGIFLTVVYGVLDPGNATFTYVNAGHNPPCVLRSDGNNKSCITLDKTGTLVGIFKENTWETNTLTLQPGEYLIFYTDGITESQNEAGEFYGLQRLKDTLYTCKADTAQELLKSLLISVQAFTGSAPRLDDVTLIVIKKE
ncbi:MAG: SpoIIE family protein phosphatase [Anaerolineaceae bacterium]|nr:SpoIIE family protein phosphatase [Anaerolineaceae bacterium]